MSRSLFTLVEQRGIEPRTASVANDAKPKQKCANSIQFSALEGSPDSTNQQKPALSKQNPSTSERQERAPSVHQDRDLAEVIESWSELSDKVKARVLKLVEESK